LESRPDFRFFTYPKDTLPDLAGYILLTLDAPPLTPADAQSGLFLIDGTWRYAEKMFSQLPNPHTFTTRSIPGHFRTAYPRTQEGCQDPERGLASIEALYAAFLVTGRDPAGFLDHYHWKEAFLEKNGLGNL
jgi:pre-rRNA-processing protein TSR3